MDIVELIFEEILIMDRKYRKYHVFCSNIHHVLEVGRNKSLVQS